MNGLDLVRRSASLDRPPKPPSKKEMKEIIMKQEAEYYNHAAETGFFGKAAWIIEEDGTEHWWHENANGEMVKYEQK